MSPVYSSPSGEPTCWTYSEQDEVPHERLAMRTTASGIPMLLALHLSSPVIYGFGSRGWDRTSNLDVNSVLLCH